MTFTVSFCSRSGTCHDSAVDASMALLSDRPAPSMPKKPASVATQRVDPGWLNAALICVASVPLTPAALLTDDAWRCAARNPAAPTRNSKRGTKKRNSLNAMALPSTLPAG